MGDAFGMAHRVGYRHGTALRNAEQREAIEPSSIDYGLEIADENLERNLFDVAIGKAIATRVIADQRVIARQVAIEAAPDRLSKSNSRCVIQFPDLTSGGPLPVRA